MKFSQGLGVILGTTTLALVQYQPVSALTSVQVNDIAKPITVMIGGLDGKGSGVIIAKNGNTYTVLTANHVVKKAGYGDYEIITHDGQKYPMEKSARTLGYDLFLSGSPRPGMSGGPILNDQGEVIGIYGKAEFGRSELGLARDGVQGIPTEKFPNLISNIPHNTQANTTGNNISPRTEPTPVIFQKLEALLQAGKWRDADLETWQLMKKLTKREQQKRWLRLVDVKNFPRQELRKMDQLWLKYSNGKFGFSVQKQIWLDLGGKLDGEPDWDTYDKLSERVGWRNNDKWLPYDDYTFSTNALPRHLPGWFGGGRGSRVIGYGFAGKFYPFFSRL